jgi:hypothetical protein
MTIKRIKFKNVIVESFFDERRGRWRLLRYNKGSSQAETFYNDQNQMMEWETEREAWDWFLQQPFAFKVGGQHE